MGTHELARPIDRNHPIRGNERSLESVPVKASILAILLAFPVSKYDAQESIEDRTARLDVVAQAIEDVARGDRLKAAFLVTQARHESAFRRDVQMCQCPPLHCDRGLAHSIWQLHRVPSLPVEVWHGYCGLDLESVRAAAERSAWPYDPRRLENSFARLGGLGVPVTIGWVVKRAAEARQIARKL
jgi:hypothetical protein